MLSYLRNATAVLALCMIIACSNGATDDERLGASDDHSYLLMRNQVLPAVSMLARSLASFSNARNYLVSRLMICDLDSDSCQRSMFGPEWWYHPTPCGDGGMEWSGGGGDGFQWGFHSAGFGCPNWAISYSEADTIRYLNPSVDSSEVELLIHLALGHWQRDSLNAFLDLAVNVTCEDDGNGSVRLDGKYVWSLHGAIQQGLIVIDSVYIDGVTEITNLVISSDPIAYDQACPSSGRFVHNIYTAVICDDGNCDSLGSWRIEEEFTGAGVANQKIWSSEFYWLFNDTERVCGLHDVSWDESSSCASLFRALGLIE